MIYPFIANINGPWNLVAHPNGPAIYAEFASGDWILASLEEYHTSPSIPPEIRHRAIRLYLEISWPKIKGDYLETPRA